MNSACYAVKFEMQLLQSTEKQVSEKCHMSNYFRMKGIKLILIVVALFSVVVSVNAQGSKLRKANQLYEAGGYHKAAGLYKVVLDEGYSLDKDEKAVILFKMGECYRLINNPKRAEVMYRKALAKNYNQPILHLYYGDMMRMNEKIEEAKKQYEEYNKLMPDDPRGEVGIKSCELIEKWQATPSGYIVQNMRIFNTKQSEFSPIIASDDGRTLYFTTSREGTSGSKESHATGEGFTDVFKVQEDRTGRWSTPEPVSEEINTEVDEGICSFSSDLQTLYFTRCRVNKRDKLGCEIYTIQRTDDEWGQAELLKVSEDSIVVAHPSISSDDLELYFVSDLPGGFGGKDIWKITRESAGGEWGQPENLGSDINTKGDEFFPYIRSNGVLYFSSNGHIGMGGLDIFKAMPKETGGWEIENMRFPINSAADDFGIIFEGDLEKGYFSSARRSGRGSDDIFRFHLPPINFNIYGKVKNAETGDLVAKAGLKLIGSDGSMVKSTSLEDGTFKFMLKPNTDYVIVSSLKGYLNGKDKASTKGLEQSKDFQSEVLMTAYSEEKTFELPNILYDFGSWELRPESMVALDQLIEILNDNPTITIELGSHTDNRGNLNVNYELSQNRAQSVIDYLIENGIAAARLKAKGYASTQPKNVDAAIAAQHDFLKEGNVLDETFINGLSSEVEKEIAHQINRRTEFRVLSDDFKE